MSISRITAVSLLLLTFVSCFFVLDSLGADDEDVAVSTIGSAEEAVVSAYRAVLEAEEAGADVSGLLERLNVATEYLALAKICSRREHFNSASGNASLCIDAAEGIAEDAGVLRDRAVREKGERSWMMISGSIVGVVLTVSVNLLGWSFFKERYCRRVLKMKPEVSEAES